VSLIGIGRSFGYDLRMELSGTVEKPVLTFFSTPSLESEQILLMVMAGETPQNEITYTAGERVARLGTYLGQSLLWQFGANPESADKLSVKVGERVSRHGRETYGLEYELTPRWSVIGEYDEFDEYNLGVKWKVYTSKPDPKEAADAK
jgi:translocation and assembly module TamB